MEIRSLRNIWIAGLLLAILFITLPNQGLSRSVRASKNTKSKEGLTHRRTQFSKATQATQANQGVLQYEARSVVLMDGLTGQVLYEQNPQLRIGPASFVKILTLYLAFDALRAGQLKMDDMVTVSERAWRTQGSKMFIKVGDRVRVEDLLKGIAIASGNDACIALAEHLSGSEEVFVAKMNEKAKLLGLKDSQFRNADGMPADGQYTTAMDMAILSLRYIEDHPEALSFHSATEFEYNGILQGNRNTLLQKNIGVDGLKTGHIEESGYHLTATAKRDNQRMIAVVMGCDSIRERAQEAQKLLEYGFKNFSTVEAVKKGAPFGPVKVKRGKVKEITLIAEGDARVTVAKGKEKTVSVIPQLPPNVVAPLQKGQVLAKILVQNEGKVAKEVSLISSSNVEKSILPSWPVIGAGLLGIAIIGMIGLWWARRPKRRTF